MFRKPRERETEGQRVWQGLARTRRGVFQHLTRMLGQERLSEEDWEQLEALLIQADVGVPTTLRIVETLRQQDLGRGLAAPELARQRLAEELLGLLGQARRPEPQAETSPLVVLVVGVNGTGKTTSIAKLAHAYQAQGRRIMLAAGDTFRAGAIEQLEIWARRLGVPVLAPQLGADPAAVAYDALQRARREEMDVLIVDTAGRLHTSHNLMEELRKVHRVLAQNHPGAPHDVLLVIDATTGQNALSQARTFQQAVGVKGVVVAKLDGSAKGGMVFALAHELGLPIAYLGTGEDLADWEPFQARAFVQALLEEE